MGHIARILAALAILAAGTLPLAAFDGPTQTTAPKKKAGAADKAATDAPADPKSGVADEKQKIAELAQRTLDAGIKAFQAGKSDEAIKGLDAALHAGLSGQQTARALYYRGLVNRKLGKPGLAISDLTSALWLKDGLVGPEREAALSSRAAAYQEAGISAVPDVPQSSFSADTSSTTGWQTAMNGSPVPPAPASVSAPVSAPSMAPAAAPVSPAAPRAPVKTATTPGYLSSISGHDAGVPAPAAEAPGPDPARRPGSSLAATSAAAQGGPQDAPKPASSIGGFFSSIGSVFGIGTSSSNTPNANDGTVTTASIAPPPEQQPAAAPVAQTTGWSQTTEVTPSADAGSAFVTKVAIAGRGAKSEKAIAAREPSGKFRLQVAAVRSRGEADALAASLVAKHGGELGARQPEVTEAVLGNMGTFYRVRVGPYADAKEPQQLCGGLRSSGFDCLVVIQ
jgi:tetratricopeptide (TPR) repeat protein